MFGSGSISSLNQAPDCYVVERKVDVGESDWEDQSARNRGSINASIFLFIYSLQFHWVFARSSEECAKLKPFDICWRNKFYNSNGSVAILTLLFHLSSSHSSFASECAGFRGRASTVSCNRMLKFWTQITRITMWDLIRLSLTGDEKNTLYWCQLHLCSAYIGYRAYSSLQLNFFNSSLCCRDGC